MRETVTQPYNFSPIFTPPAHRFILPPLFLGHTGTLNSNPNILWTHRQNLTWRRASMRLLPIPTIGVSASVKISIGIGNEPATFGESTAWPKNNGWTPIRLLGSQFGAPVEMLLSAKFISQLFIKFLFYWGGGRSGTYFLY
jgi:hypothetical protein